MRNRLFLFFLIFLKIAVASITASPSDDIAAMLTPSGLQIYGNTSFGVGTAGWADIDRLYLYLRGGTLYGVSIPANMLWLYPTPNHFTFETSITVADPPYYYQPSNPISSSYASSTQWVYWGMPDGSAQWNYAFQFYWAWQTWVNNNSHWVYPTHQEKHQWTPQQGFDWVKSAYPWYNYRPDSSYSLVGEYYYSELSAWSAGSLSAWLYSDNPTPTGSQYYSGRFSRHAYVAVAKSDTPTPRAWIYIVGFDIEKYNSTKGSSTNEGDSGDWLLGFHGVQSSSLIGVAAQVVSVSTITGTTTEKNGDSPTPGLIRITRQLSSGSTTVTGNWTINPGRTNVQATWGNGASLTTSGVTGTFSVTFGEGETTKDIYVSATFDNIYDASETFTVNVDRNDAAYYLSNGTGAVSITQVPKNACPIARISVSPSTISENGGSATYAISLSDKPTKQTVVRYAVGGSAASTRFQSLPGSQTFPANDTYYTGRTTILNAINNTLVDGNQTVTLTLLASPSDSYQLDGSNLLSQYATTTILDDEDNLVTITADASNAVRGGSSAVFRVIRTGTNLQPIDVPVTLGGTAQEGRDFEPFSTTIHFNQGVSQVPVTVVPVDGNFTSPVTLIVTLAPGYPNTPTAPYRITSPTTATITISPGATVRHVNINAVIFSGASTPKDAVDARVVDGTSVHGGIIALGGGAVTSGTSPAVITPDSRYLEGVFIPPITPYGIDIRTKAVTEQAK